MALEGVPPPPGSVPPPPPPPPPPGGPAALSAEAQAAVAELRAQLGALQARLPDEGVQAQIDALYTQHYNNWKDAAQHQQQLEAQIEAIKSQMADVRNTTEVDVKNLRAIFEKITSEIQTLQRQNDEPALQAFPDIIAGIQRLIETKSDAIRGIPDQIDRITHESNSQIEELDNQSKPGSPLVLQLRHYKQETLAPLKALKDVFPSKFQRAGAGAPAARVLKLKEWYDQGIIAGIFFENLKQFILREEHVRDNEVEEKYTVESVLKKYTEFLKSRYLVDERHILGIATGYMTRDYANHETRYLRNELKPLENAINDETRLPLLENRLQALYNQNQALRDTAPISLNAPGAEGIAVGGIAAVAESIQQFTHREANRAAQNRSPAQAGSSSSSSSSAAAVPANRGAQLAALEARGQQAFQMGNELQAAAGPIAQRGGPRNVANLAQMQQEMDRVNREFEGFLGFADRAIAESARRIADLLGVEGEATLEATMEKLEVEVEKLKDKAETPEVILSNEWARDKNAAFTHAFECYSKKQGRKPNAKEMGTWSQCIPANDRPAFVELLRKYAR